MDEYAEYVYQRRPEYRHLSAGDMTAQKELRNRLNCKNFKWFMSEVAWDLPKHYPPVEPPAAAWGEVRTGLWNCFDNSEEIRSDIESHFNRRYVLRDYSFTFEVQQWMYLHACLST